MKKLFLFCFLLVLFSCSDNTIESNDQLVVETKEENLNLTSRFSLCPQGYHLAWELVDTPIRLFKKSGCSGGFGFCFQVGMIWSFDCVRNTSPISQRISFNNSKNEVNTIAIENTENKTIKFYFHKDVVYSQDNFPSDFDFFDVENDVYISEGYKLVGGSYPKEIEGDYFIYTVPYSYEDK